MLRDKKIAVFIDVDNSLLDSEGYERVMEQIRSMGEIVCGTVYGASERKHKKVIEQATDRGYVLQPAMRLRRRVRKVFDDRIFVDVTALVQRNLHVDTIAIISGATDLVYLFSYLRRLGLQVIAANNLDEQSTALAAETIDVSAAPVKKPVAKPVARPAKPAVAQSVVAQPKPVVEEPKTVVDEEDRTEALLREINKLRADYDAVKAPVVEEPQPAAEPQPDIVAEAQTLLQQVASLNEQPAVEEVASPQVEQVEQAPEQPKEEAPRASYVSQNDSDLIRKIEQLRQNGGGDSDDMVAEIKKLLDGLE